MGSGYSQEISSLKEEISDLRKEIEELRSSQNLSWRLSVLQDFFDLIIEKRS